MIIGAEALGTVKSVFANGVAVTNRWVEQCGCYETAGCNQFWQVQNARRLEVLRCNPSQQSVNASQAQAQASQLGN